MLKTLRAKRSALQTSALQFTSEISALIFANRDKILRTLFMPVEKILEPRLARI